MIVWVITALDTGYNSTGSDSETHEVQTHAHNKRITAVNEIMKQIPAKRQFQIVLLDEETK